MSLVTIICAHCGGSAQREAGAVNRSHRRNAPLYCGKACTGIARRQYKDAEQKRAEKAGYDRQRRKALGEALRSEKRAAYYDRLARDPEGLRAAQKSLRQRRKADHLEYCRAPEYRKWKSQYDQKYRAGKWFGDFGEAAIILNQLEAEISTRATRIEIYRANGTLNKSNERKRDYARQTGRAQRG